MQQSASVSRKKTLKKKKVAFSAKKLDYFQKKA